MTIHRIEIKVHITGNNYVTITMFRHVNRVLYVSQKEALESGGR